MPTSEQITAKINETANPDAAEYKLWTSTRYLVAQKPASPSSQVTKDGYFNGCHVIPGPKANPNLSARLNETDWKMIKNRHYIRFTDVKTTANADQSIGRSLYTRMDDVQADEYEKILSKLRGV